MDPLDLPRTIPAAAAEARKLGIPISDWKAWRMAREGRLPVAEVGQKMTTLRHLIAALSPAGMDMADHTPSVTLAAGRVSR